MEIFTSTEALVTVQLYDLWAPQALILCTSIRKANLLRDILEIIDLFDNSSILEVTIEHIKGLDFMCNFL